MAYKKSIIGIAFVAAALIISAFSLSDKVASGVWRYKITIEVETPDGIKSGSAIREISISRNDVLNQLALPESHTPINVKGEAVLVDLGKQGPVFALIDDTSYYELFKAFPFKGGSGESTIEGIKYYNTLKPGMKADLPAMYYPAFVTFKDIKDIKSVTLVREKAFSPMRDGQQPVDHFEAIFGAGFQLKDITVEITQEPLNWGIVTKYLGQRHAIANYEFVRGNTE